MNLQDIYDNVYENIDNIMENFEHVLSPRTNNFTHRYITEGYSVEEAYALAFTGMMATYMQVSGVEIKDT